MTIPKQIREQLGLMPHCEVEFSIVGTSVLIRKNGQRMSRGERMVEHLRGRGNRRFTTEQIMAMTRGD